ncbi:MAG: mannose-1-phosphate guanylyltransferase/mannose-6-phosphate isomerase [Kiloniellaceae bacterium]
MTIDPVILSGGSGTRLWPLSRSLSPKQLYPLASEYSLLQDALRRVADDRRFHAPLIVCNHAHRFMIGEQARAIGIAPSDIVVEPEGRNTAPAIAVAAVVLAEKDPEATLLVMPSDHVIERSAAYLDAVETGLQAAADGRFLTFGITPDAPETGYGYIRRGGEIESMPGCYAVERFVEKPDKASAEAFLAAGDYYWNSGIFLFRAGRYLAELQRLEPELLAACRAAVDHGTRDLDFFRLGAQAFAGAKSISIDHAVMERSETVAMVPMDIGWRDVGSWATLWEIGDKDSSGNVLAGDAVVADTRNSYIRSQGPLVAALGVEDLIVIATEDSLLVVPRDRAQDIRRLVAEMKAQGRPEVASHGKVSRPWGFYRSVDAGERFQVKRLVVNPGASLSLQSHRHRAEHWVVVKGTARVTRGEEVLLLRENQSTYIPVETVHRLENPGDEPLHVIEVQSGGYLGEDDIVRFEDNYGRIPEKSGDG